MKKLMMPMFNFSNQSVNILIVRHGQSIYQCQKVIAGLNEFGLSGLGKLQVSNLARQLGDIDFDEIYTSDLKRCIETFDIIRQDLKFAPQPNQITFTHLLRERDHGENQLKTYDQIKEYEPIINKRSYRPPKGESWLDVHERAQLFYNFLALKHLSSEQFQFGLDNLSSFLTTKNFQGIPSIRQMIPYFFKSKKTSYQPQFGYFLETRQAKQKNILIITHGGFICESLLYLKSRESNSFFSPSKMQEEEDLQIKESLYAKNASVFQITLMKDKETGGWNSDIRQRNLNKGSYYPFEGVN